MSYVICHGSLCHNMNICHDVNCYSSYLAKMEQKFNINPNTLLNEVYVCL